MNPSPRVLLRLGVRSLLVHKLRSVLSILGVVFGVAARREAVAQIGSLGIDTLTVRARPAAGAASTPGSVAPIGLRMREAEAVQARPLGFLGVARVLVADQIRRTAEVIVQKLLEQHEL